MNGCAPDDNTRALVVARDGIGNLAGPALQGYLDRGGIVIGEYNINHTLFNLAFGANAVQGAGNGDCGDAVMPAVQQNPADPFWQTIRFAAPGAGSTGCGFDLTALPGITRLGGWTAGTTSLAYRDRNAGRVWLVEADWQDVDVPAGSALIDPLMGYMITHGAGANLLNFAGVRQALPVAAVVAGGFRECFRDTYADSVPTLAQIQAGCGGQTLMMACRPTGSNTLTLAAMAPRADVLFDTGAQRGQPLHTANGVDWYYNASYSWGFAPGGAGADLFSCDVANTVPEQRMCWHTGGGQIDSGYRCGATFPFDGTYERIIYAR